MQRTRRAELVEVYLPLNGPDGDAASAAVVLIDRLALSTVGPRLLWATYVADEELLLIVLQPGAGEPLSEVLAAAGRSALRVTPCLVVGPCA